MFKQTNTHIVTPQFAQNRAWLAELGILFEIEKEKLNVSDNDDYKKAFTLILEDANEILQSGIGYTVQEIAAARKDEAQATGPMRSSAAPEPLTATVESIIGSDYEFYDYQDYPHFTESMASQSAGAV